MLCSTPNESKDCRRVMAKVLNDMVASPNSSIKSPLGDHPKPENNQDPRNVALNRLRK